MAARATGLGRRLLFVGLLLAGSAVESVAEETGGGIELTTQVRLELKRLQDSWQSWTRAYFQDEEEEARGALSHLLSVVESLGMEKLPDHAAAAAAFAVRSAEEGNVTRARWAVACARELDPGRPEPDLAASAVEWSAGNYPRAVVDRMKGYLKLFRLPLEGHLFRQTLGLALLYLLALSGGLFLVLLMVFRGADLFHDLGRLVSPPLGRGPADVAALLLLVWPLLLPSGVLWLAAYWLILLWGYTTSSQRAVLVTVLVVLGIAPAAIGYHQDEVRKELLPPIRAFENIESGRLYGSLFLDLEVLSDLLSESPVVTELIADLHRDFGQWEYARLVYDQMIQENPGSAEIAPALNNVGIFYYGVRQDYGSAITFFTNATEADPSYAEAWYNLSRAYSANLAFTEAHRPMAEAKKRDSARVEEWERRKSNGQDVIVPINGGLAKADEVRRALDELATDPDGSSSRLALVYPSLGAGLVALAAAVAFDLFRKKKGYPSSKFTARPAFARNRWLEALVPGWASTREGEGIRAFLAVLFAVAMVLIPILRRSTIYRAYLGYDAGPAVASITCAAVLVTYLGFRLVRTWRANG